MYRSVLPPTRRRRHQLREFNFLEKDVNVKGFRQTRSKVYIFVEMISINFHKILWSFHERREDAVFVTYVLVGYFFSKSRNKRNFRKSLKAVMAYLKACAKIVRKKYLSPFLKRALWIILVSVETSHHPFTLYNNIQKLMCRHLPIKNF